MSKNHDSKSKKKHEVEEVADMDFVLKQQKKKLMVRMKNYKFSSINDIFESREDKDRDLIH